METEVPATTEDVRQQARTKLLSIVLFFSALLMLVPIDPAILCVLWNWFAIKVGFHSLTYGHAFGLYLLLRFIVSPGSPIKINLEKGRGWPDNPKDLWFPVASAYTGCLITLSVGGMIHLLSSQ